MDSAKNRKPRKPRKPRTGKKPRKPPKVKNETKFIRHSHIRSYYKAFIIKYPSYQRKRIGFEALDDIASEVESFLLGALEQAKSIADNNNLKTIQESHIPTYNKARK